MVLITVALMLHVQLTMLVASPLPVIRAIHAVEMNLHIASVELNALILQILMSVPLVLITVTLMLSVPTPLVASPVPVTRATVEMDSPVWVSSSPGLRHIDSVEIKFQILMSVPLVIIAVTLMLSVPTPLVASPVPAMMATVEMDLLVQVLDYLCWYIENI